MTFKLVISDRFVVPRFVDDGDVVIAPYVNNGRRTGLRCVVTVAAGYHARVVNDVYRFARWFHIDDLRLETES